MLLFPFGNLSHTSILYYTILYDIAVFEQYGIRYNPILLGQKEEKMRRFCLYDFKVRKILIYLCLRKSTFFFFSSWIWWSLSFSCINCAPQFWHLRIGLWCTSFECLISCSCLSNISWQISQRFFLRKSRKPISLQ